MQPDWRGVHADLRRAWPRPGHPAQPGERQRGAALRLAGAHDGAERRRVPAVPRPDRHGPVRAARPWHAGRATGDQARPPAAGRLSGRAYHGTGALPDLERRPGRHLSARPGRHHRARRDAQGRVRCRAGGIHRQGRPGRQHRRRADGPGLRHRGKQLLLRPAESDRHGLGWLRRPARQPGAASRDRRVRRAARLRRPAQAAQLRRGARRRDGRRDRCRDHRQRRRPRADRRGRRPAGRQRPGDRPVLRRLSRAAAAVLRLRRLSQPAGRPAHRAARQLPACPGGQAQAAAGARRDHRRGRHRPRVRARAADRPGRAASRRGRRTGKHRRHST